jgi:hypothetical protein
MSKNTQNLNFPIKKVVKDYLSGGQTRYEQRFAEKFIILTKYHFSSEELMQLKKLGTDY